MLKDGIRCIVVVVVVVVIGRTWRVRLYDLYPFNMKLEFFLKVYLALFCKVSYMVYG